jgi:hypothetical protein
LDDVRIVVWDLGLTDGQASIIRTWCNTELKAFPFAQFPGHVSSLLTYAFKPIIISEEIKRWPAIL